MTAQRVDERLDALGRRFGLPAEAVSQLASLLALLLEDPLAPTAVRDPGRAINDHLADSLVALEVDQVRDARVFADLGSGAGLPGLPLAIALPDARFALVESSARKCAFLARAVSACGVSNVEIVNDRAETWQEGLQSCDVVTARALAPLAVVIEYAAPLVMAGGTVVAWRGRRDPTAEAGAASAAAQLGLRPAEIRHVQPYPEADNRHLHVFAKVTETPARFPRRPGMALKRPLGADDATLV